MTCRTITRMYLYTVVVPSLFCLYNIKKVLRPRTWQKYMHFTAFVVVVVVRYIV